MRADQYFAVIPEWVITTVSPRALQVYAMLRRSADWDSGDTFVGIPRLAERCGTSERTIQRALAELEEAQAIEVTPRFVNGRQTSNLYRLLSIPPDYRGDRNVTGEGVKDVAGEGDKNVVPYIESQNDLQPKDQQRSLTAKARHDGIVFALADACGYRREEITEPMWGRLHRAARQLAKVGATPEDVAYRAKVYQVNMPGIEMTPTAIAANWPSLAEIKAKPGRNEVQREIRRAQTKRALRSLE